MLVALAPDLKELHNKYGGAGIVTRVRKFYELQDSIGKISDAMLFRHAIRDYCSYAPDIERVAQGEYLDYCITGQVGYKVARCLLPGKIERQGIEI